MDLPQVDCDDSVLELVHRLGSGRQGVNTGQPTFWRGFYEWLTATPLMVRYAVLVVLLVVMALPVTNRLAGPSPAAPIVADSNAVTAPQYTPAEIQQALMDLNTAMQYLHNAGLRTEVMIGDRFIVTPIQESLDASFEVMRRANDDPLQDDPI